MKTEQQLWDSMQYAARYAGSHGAYRSDVFSLLAAILAYYKARGTEPQDMLSPELMRCIEWQMLDEYRQI